MHALIIEKPGEISIVEKDIPEISENQVLIKTKAVALNHRDQFIREGKYPAIRYGVTLGADACGEVIQIGNNANQNWLNKTVIINPNVNWGSDPKVQAHDYHILGTPTDGVFSEYIAIDAQKIIEKPTHLTLEQAAALPLAGMTAFRALFHHAKLEENEKILITGIGGGVAQFVFQFALAAKAEVYITSGASEKRNKCLEMGAKAAFNYKQEDWLKKAKSEAHGFDVVIDSAGGSALNNIIKLMNPAGRIVCYGATTGKVEELDLFRIFWNQITLQGSTMANDEEFKQMVEFVNTHKIRPIIDSVVKFDNIMNQFNRMRDGKQFGKLVAEF